MLAKDLKRVGSQKVDIHTCITSNLIVYMVHPETITHDMVVDPTEFNAQKYRENYAPDREKMEDENEMKPREYA